MMRYLSLVAVLVAAWSSHSFDAGETAATEACAKAQDSGRCDLPVKDQPTTYPRAPDADQPLKLHHVTLFSNNHERLAEWYRDMLGFEIAKRFVARRPDGAEINIIRLTMNGVWLNISRAPTLTQKDPSLEYTGWRHLAFGTLDVQRAWDSLKARGANVVGSGRVVFDPPGYATAFVRDPDGNFIEFYQDLRAPPP